MSEKLCLHWNDFNGDVIKAFGNLREDNDFADVTLASEDGHQVEAHKVILAASSPFFKDMLVKKKHNHPLIYMRGVKTETLMAMVDFLYTVVHWRSECIPRKSRLLPSCRFRSETERSDEHR